jgi:peptidyl-dipeptidase Dcp
MENIITDNPLLTPSQAPFGAPEFDRIKKEHYLPAFREAIRLYKKEIDAIASDEAEPSFANTVLALEYAGEALRNVENIFFNLLEADGDPEMQKIAEEISPELSETEMYVSMNEPLFLRVAKVHETCGTMGTAEKRLTEDTWLSFVRNGASLRGEAREEFRAINEELSLLSLKFGDNVLSSTNAFSLHLTEKADLEGLPDYVVEAAAHTAAEKGEQGWIFTLEYPSWSPFMKYSSRRDLREKMWRAYNSRALGGEHDNSGTVARMAELRLRMARLLGYETYADFALERRMAKDRKTVEHFLDTLMKPSLPKALSEIAEITEYARTQGFADEKLMPWDFSYWSEKWKHARFDIDESLLKPYFRLENCIDAVLGLAGRLYGLSFEERRDIPVYHKDVKVFDVKDADGKHLALFYADFFPRKTKRGGAWMTAFREQYRKDGQDYRPFISIVTNFSKPTAGAPSLLTLDELTTFLHEFGHSLHGMLSRGTYPSQCGTNVARDFVEFPSQIMENWAFEPEFLNSFARDYRTGETIPAEYVSRVLKARNCLSGYLQVRQLQFGVIDMAWHTLTAAPAENPEEFENRVLGPYRTLPAIPGTATSQSFNHIFSGGYSAGYYSYKWAEVLEADAFSLFQKKGVFSREVADSFRRNVLERGSSEDEAVLYRNFRGRDPQPEALLRKLGIIE